ncbi:ABC transporter BEA3 [Apiospora marii]|uniref:ABC transporter BEA3 n=1 Tax=Apiospora marii TaxID=335849 RepID=A0ABR1SU61_9PEZI
MASQKMDNSNDEEPLSITVDQSPEKGTSSQRPTPEQPKPTDRQPHLTDYLRIFSYATRWDVCIYTIGALSSLAAGVTMPLMNILFGQLASQFTQHASPSSSMPAEDFESLLSRQSLYIMALFLGRWVLNSINKFCFRTTGLRLSAAVRLHYLQSLLAQNIHALDTLPAGAPAAAITASANTLQIGVSERLGTFLQYAGTIVSALVVAFIWSWELTLVTSSLVLYSFVIMAVAMPILLKSHAAVSRADNRATAVASEALGAIRLVMAAGAQERVVRQYQRWVEEAKRQTRKTAPIFGVYFGLIYLGIFGSYGLAFWYGTKRFILEGAGGVGVVIVVLMSVMMVLTSIERISTPLTAVSKAMVAACEFFTIIDAPAPQRGGARMGLEDDSGANDIIFDNVTFAYPSRPGTKVLDGLSLRIRAGLNTAIVGRSGSGKSTIVALLERWYSLSDEPVGIPKVVQPDPNQKEPGDEDDQDSSIAPAANATMDDPPIELSGAITIAGHRVEELDVQWWRNQIGLVQQEPFLFNDSIFENVARGLIGTQWANESKSQKRQLVEHACKEAYAHEFICRLPEGYDSRIGDGGIKLSGGQRQRIAIARSIVKKPRIIILDEATSAIDVHGERIVQAALDRISQGCTTITIAHRLSTIKKADCIIVLRDGSAVEEGTHEELMRITAGHYSRLVHSQALTTLSSPGSEAKEGHKQVTTPPPVDEDAETSTHEDIPPYPATYPGPETNETTPTPASFRSFATLIQQQHIHWLFFAGVLLSAMGIAAGTPLQAWLFAKVVGVFTIQDPAQLRSAADFWAFMWLALAGGVGLSYCAAAWIGVGVQSLVGAHCKTSYLRGMLYQPLGSFFDDDANAHGTLTGRIASDAKQMEELIGLNLVIFLSGVFTVAGCFAVSLAFGWKLALIGTFVTMPVILASGLWKLRQEVKFDQLNSAVFAESAQFATEAVGAFRTVAAFNLEESIIERYRVLLDDHVRVAVRRARFNSLVFGFTDSASLGCQALVFWYGGRLLLRGEYTLEAFFVCFMAIIQGSENAGIALGLAPNAAQAFTAANRILHVQTSAESDPTPSGDVNKRGDSSIIPDTEGGAQIELRNIHFSYPTRRDVPVFRGTSLTIEKGQYAAIVGPSGCGKTTIISLLERFYDLEADSGDIFCNGTNINTLDRYSYRRDLSLVAQEPTMFQGTIRDNILLGAPEPEHISQARLEEVCHDASIHDFIASLPDGYGTDVGQRGVSLSGGQKQRIALARALIRNPKVLLLDEATSALDSESERAVQGALERARRGRTMVVVAHRLSTIQTADVIFVLDKGDVLERGTHQELLKLRGRYWNMCQSQAMDQ